MILGFIFGCWDLLHIGHIQALEYAKKRCDTLLIGIYSDEVIKKFKGELPSITERGRARIVFNLKCADVVILIKERPSTLEFGHIDKMFVSSEWKGKELPFLPKSFKGEIVYVPYTKGISSTVIKESFINPPKVKRQRATRKRGKT